MKTLGFFEIQLCAKIDRISELSEIAVFAEMPEQNNEYVNSSNI